MNLNDIIRRTPPKPWQDGDNIPWNEPRFSRAMLQEHLSQQHDAASRRSAIIDRHVDFIHTRILGGQPSRILDLGCGPGLYLQRLARLGHTCRGIDFSPASIEFAVENAWKDNLSCNYELADLREADYGRDFDLVMLLYGEFNVFRPAHIRQILRKAQAALKPGGILLLEPSREDSIRRQAEEAPGWYSSPKGLFSDNPHLVLMESAWDEEQKVCAQRHILIDAESGAVTLYGASYQAYSQEEYRALLEECGFTQVNFYSSLTGEDQHKDLIALSAIKKTT